VTFARIGQFKALPEKTEELKRVYEAEAIPAIRWPAGNISAVLLQQHDASVSFLAIAVWKTEQDARTYDQSGQAAKMVDKIRFAFAGPPVLTTYDAFGAA